MVQKARSRLTEVGGDPSVGGAPPTNGAAVIVETALPYVATVGITGTADVLFHAWNCEAVEEKAKAAKGSKAKKSDDLESYVYRLESGELAIPGEYLRQSVIHAAKFRQDPRSPRKSAMDLFKAGVQSLTLRAGLGVRDWDYEHKCRVVIHGNAVTRTRPALKAGWEATFQLSVLLAEYIPPAVLHDVLVNAGRLIGLGDFRPSYGRFAVTTFTIGLID